MNVLVIPEDFRNDQYILRPIFQEMFKRLGKTGVKLSILTDPLLGGVGEALKWRRICEIIERYEMVHLFLLCIDRDGDITRRSKLDNIEKKASEFFSSAKKQCLYAENAWQEIEAWALAGLELPIKWKWETVRSEPNVKEKFFIPFVRNRELMDSPGQGRKELGIEAAKNYRAIRDKCRDDVLALENRIKYCLKKK